MGFLEGSGEVPACGEAIMVAIRIAQSSILIYTGAGHPICDCDVLSYFIKIHLERDEETPGPLAMH